MIIAAPLLGSIAMTIVSTAASRHNYPAAHALRALHRLRSEQECANSDEHRTSIVHIDAAAAMDGISQFVYEPSGKNSKRCTRWRYDKTEDEERVEWKMVQWRVSGRRRVKGFCGVLEQRGFERVEWRRLRITTSERIFVLRNANVSSIGVGGSRSNGHNSRNDSRCAM